MKRWLAMFVVCALTWTIGASSDTFTPIGSPGSLPLSSIQPQAFNTIVGAGCTSGTCSPSALTLGSGLAIASSTISATGAATGFTVTYNNNTNPAIQPSVHNTTSGVTIAAGAVNAGSALNTAQCIFNQETLYSTSELAVEGSGDLQYCTGYQDPIFGMQMMDNSGAGVGGLMFVNSNGDGPTLGVTTASSSTCKNVFGTAYLPTIGSACSYLDAENDYYAINGGNLLPLVIGWGATIAEGYFGSNAAWFAIGNTTPVKYLQALSTGTNQATLTLGDTNSGSIVNIQAGGGIAIKGAATVGTGYSLAPAGSGTITANALSNGTVTLASHAALAANSIIGNSTGSPATPTALPSPIDANGNVQGTVGGVVSISGGACTTGYTCTNNRGQISPSSTSITVTFGGTSGNAFSNQPVCVTTNAGNNSTYTTRVTSLSNTSAAITASSVSAIFNYICID